MIPSIVVRNFDRYNPPHKAVNVEVRKGGPLRWLRWEVDAHRDPDLLDMPVGWRWLWLVLLDLAAKEPKVGDDRVIRLTTAQLAREADMAEGDVVGALEHLRKRGRIRYAAKGGGRVVKRHPAPTDRVAEGHRDGGHVPTDAHTYVPHARARGQTAGMRHISNGIDRVSQRFTVEGVA